MQGTSADAHGNSRLSTPLKRKRLSEHSWPSTTSPYFPPVSHHRSPEGSSPQTIAVQVDTTSRKEPGTPRGNKRATEASSSSPITSPYFRRSNRAQTESSGLPQSYRTTEPHTQAHPTVHDSRRNVPQEDILNALRDLKPELIQGSVPTYIAN